MSSATPDWPASAARESTRHHAASGKRRSCCQLLDQRRNGIWKRAVYLSFDDDRLASLELEQLGFLLEEYYRRYPALRGRETVHWFLDEIQLVPGWERFVRRVLDSEKVEIVVSGSSARMLSREVHTSLRGRGMATVIRPFSFREFLRHRGEEPTQEPRRWTPPSGRWSRSAFASTSSRAGSPKRRGCRRAADRAPAGLRGHRALPRRGRALRGVAGGRAPLAGAAMPAQPGRELQRPPAAPGPEGPGARRGEGRRPRDARPSPRRLPAQRRAAGDRLGAPAQLQPAQALSRRPGPHQGLRRQRPREPGPRARDRRAERAGDGAGPRSATSRRPTGWRWTSSRATRPPERN